MNGFVQTRFHTEATGNRNDLIILLTTVQFGSHYISTIYDGMFVNVFGKQMYQNVYSVVVK